MRVKCFLLGIFCLSLFSPAEAQILKKIKKKAEQAAERTVLKKTDEEVSEATEGAIDSVTEGNKDNPEANSPEADSDSPNVTQQGGTVMNPIMSKNADNSALPDSYVFDWELKMEMSSSDDEKIQMNYLLKSGESDYAGMEMSTEESRKQGKVQMVMDAQADAIIMFMDGNGQKMAQMSKLPDPKGKDNDEEFTYKEIGTKTILGYECFGIEVENKGYKAQMYYTLDAPVSFNAFFSFSKKGAPKGFDPALVEVLKEEGLLMEMHAVNKKKNDESYNLTAVSLDKKDTTIKKADYQFMQMGF